MTRMFGLSVATIAATLALGGCVVAGPPGPYYANGYEQPGYVAGPAIVIGGGGGYYGHGGAYYGHGGYHR